MTKKYTFMRTSPEFKKQLEEIKLARVRTGRDDTMKSDRRLTLALTRSSLFPKLKEVLIESDMEKEKDD